MLTELYRDILALIIDKLDQFSVYKLSRTSRGMQEVVLAIIRPTSNKKCLSVPRYASSKKKMMPKPKDTDTILRKLLACQYCNKINKASCFYYCVHCTCAKCKQHAEPWFFNSSEKSQGRIEFADKLRKQSFKCIGNSDEGARYEIDAIMRLHDMLDEQKKFIDIEYLDYVSRDHRRLPFRIVKHGNTLFYEYINSGRIFRIYLVAGKYWCFDDRTSTKLCRECSDLNRTTGSDRWDIGQVIDCAYDATRKRYGREENIFHADIGIYRLEREQN